MRPCALRVLSLSWHLVSSGACARYCPDRIHLGINECFPRAMNHLVFPSGNFVATPVVRKLAEPVRSLVEGLKQCSPFIRCWLHGSAIPQGQALLFHAPAERVEVKGSGPFPIHFSSSGGGVRCWIASCYPGSNQQEAPHPKVWGSCKRWVNKNEIGSFAHTLFYAITLTVMAKTLYLQHQSVRSWTQAPGKSKNNDIQGQAIPW